MEVYKLIIILILLVGCSEKIIPATCQNITTIETIEKIVYVDKPIDRIVYVNMTQNVSNCSTAVYDKVNLNLIHKVDYYKRYIDDYINLDNCTDYIEFRENQTRLANQTRNCIDNLKRVNDTLNYDLRRLNDSLNSCNVQLDICRE